MPATPLDRKPPPGGDVYSALGAQWGTIAARRAARDAMRGWAERHPTLAGFASPADLVALISQMGHPDRSCALLAELLVVAGDDDLAGRAVLQAILPGLRRCAHRSSRRPAGARPWNSPDEIAADTIAYAWEAIHAHAGQHHTRPARVLIDAVEARLRADQRGWLRHTAHTTDLPAEPGAPSTDADGAGCPEEQAAETIMAAAHAGIIDRTQAVMLYSVGVLGYPINQASRHAGLDPSAGYRTLTRARAVLRSPAPTDTSRRLERSATPGRRRPRRPLTPVPTSGERQEAHCGGYPLLLRPPEAAALLGISRSKLYDLLKAGALRSVTIDAARRIPYADLAAYVEGLRHPNHVHQVEQPAVPMPTAPTSPTKRASSPKPSRRNRPAPLQLRFDDLTANGPP